MRKLFWIFFTLLSVPLIAQTSSADNDFARANELYRAEKFSEAVGLYEQILKTGQHSPELYLNLGNSYYKLNKVGPAVYFYEKGLILDPRNNTIKNNLKFAQQMMLDEVKEVHISGYSVIVSQVTKTFAFDTWAWMAVGAGFLVLISFAGYYFGNSSLQKRIFFATIILMLIGLFISLFSAFYEKDRQEKERPAIVFAAVASIKGEPKQGVPDAASVHEGTKVYVLEELDGWKRVLLPEGSDGWIESSAIRELK